MKSLLKRFITNPSFLSYNYHTFVFSRNCSFLAPTKFSGDGFLISTPHVRLYENPAKNILLPQNDAASPCK